MTSQAQWEDARESLTRLVGAREKILSEAEAAWKNREEGAAAQLQDAQELAAEASAELASVHVEFGDHEEAVPRYQSALAMQKAYHAAPACSSPGPASLNVAVNLLCGWNIGS